MTLKTTPSRISELSKKEWLLVSKYIGDNCHNRFIPNRDNAPEYYESIKGKLPLKFTNGKSIRKRKYMSYATRVFRTLCVTDIDKLDRIVFPYIGELEIYEVDSVGRERIKNGEVVIEDEFNKTPMYALRFHLNYRRTARAIIVSRIRWRLIRVITRTLEAYNLPIGSYRDIYKHKASKIAIKNRKYGTRK